MASKLLGLYDWGLSRNKDGHRDYNADFLVETEDTMDGPSIVLATPGLPAIGSYWSFGNDVDVNSYCSPEMVVRPWKTKGEPGKTWMVNTKFSTRPLNRCQETAVENPLAEPARLSGSFIKTVREATRDKDGNPILTSSHEVVRGKVVERDFSRPTIRVGINSLILPLTSFSYMVDTLNDSMLWGMPARTIKLSNVSWTRKLYGICTYYYTVDYEFEVSTEFDVDFLDEGTMVLAPGGNPNDPRDFVRYKDANEENPDRVLLDGNGSPLDDISNPVEIHLEKYAESNFLLLGIPVTL